MIVLNHTLAFLLEIVLLFALPRAVFDLGTGAILPWLLAMLAGGVLIAIWGRFAAPKSRHRLAGPSLVIFKTAMFSLATAALATTYGALPAALYAVLAVMHLVLALRLGIL